MEFWKDIKGYEGLYQVSNLGRVKSLPRTWATPNGGIRTHGEQILCSNIVNEYLYVTLYKDNKRKAYRVQRLVADAFIPNPLGLPYVNHKNEDKTNNTVWVNDDGIIDLEKSNLEWCNPKYNVNYGTGIQRSSEKHINGKKSKTILQYTLEGEFVKEWPSSMEIERQLGYANASISRCCRGERNCAHGFIWKYI